MDGKHSLLEKIPWHKTIRKRSRVDATHAACRAFESAPMENEHADQLFHKISYSHLQSLFFVFVFSLYSNIEKKWVNIYLYICKCICITLSFSCLINLQCSVEFFVFSFSFSFITFAYALIQTSFRSPTHLIN